MEIQSIPEMIAWSEESRRAGRTLGFVPTMGALHAGHQSLIRRAKGENDRVVVSIFVNPLQFGPNEDYGRYPRDEAGDRRKAVEAGGDILFFTTPEEMYPKGFQTYVVPEGFASRFEGASRPGHFRGVATAVLKLFQVVRPHRAYFGQKDAQQLALVDRMVRDLHVDVELVPCPTVRDADGLALSSRNAFLPPVARDRALCLSRALRAADRLYRGGERRARVLVLEARAVIEKTPGVALDYLALVDPDTWEEVEGGEVRGRLVAAVRVGKTRLIDNHLLGEEGL